MGFWLRIVVTVALILQTIDNIFVSSLQDNMGNTHASWKEKAQTGYQKYPFMKDASQSPPQNSYDYIIVGGGTAGCPLAATLSRKFSVLLLERGGHPYGNDNITRVERFVISLADNEGQHTPAQQFVSEDGVVNTRPRVLGGGSCLNAGFYSRTSPEWVRFMNWDGNLVNKSYPWVENVVAFAPELGTFQSAFRNALLEVGVLPYNHQTYDHLIGTKIGGSIFDNNGSRHTAADLLQYAVKKNISVLLHAQVQQILFNNTGGQPRAYGVQYVDINGQQHTATLTDNKKGEVILSAGALGSPQLLMLSGIGPAEHLEAMGIKTLINLTTVGKNMADNPMNGIFLATKEPVETALIQVVGITNFGSYIESGSGDMSFRYSSVESPFGHMAELLEKVMGPLSTGELYLRSLDAADNPRVTFNYFAHPQDLARCVEGMSLIESIALSDTFKSIVFDNQSLPSGRTVGEARSSGIGLDEGQFQSNLESFCKKNVGTIWHYHGGCSIGSVVDENLHVLGVDALRVIDGSTFNFSPGTNPQATVMMLGRYMGEKILKEREKDDS